MEKNGIFEEKIIEVENGKKYYVIKQLLHNNILYLLVNELENEETPSDTIAILKVSSNVDGVIFTLEKDEIILKELLQKFSDLM